MEEYEIEENGETGETIEPIDIIYKEKNYNLNFEIKDENIIFSIIENEEFFLSNFTTNIELKEFKNLSTEFKNIKSYNDLYNYIKPLSDNKKINIKKNNDKITLILLIDKQPIEIDLFRTKKDIDYDFLEICKELSNVKEKIKDMDKVKNENKELNQKINEMFNEISILKTENKNLNKKIDEMNIEIIELKNENKKFKENNGKQYIEVNKFKEGEIKDIIKDKKDLDNNKSEIMEEDDKKMIYLEIENKMNKKIKEIKKLYQATKDGGDSKIFHLKCDNIPNTLVLIKSEGQKRFGGFTPIPWKSEEIWKYIQDSEMKTFVFSLDNKTIYNLKNEKVDSVYHEKNCGPCFGNGWDIGFEGNPLEEKRLITFKNSFDYKGDKNSLSEFVNGNEGKIIEYEVFEVIFYNSKY